MLIKILWLYDGLKNIFIANKKNTGDFKTLFNNNRYKKDKHIYLDINNMLCYFLLVRRNTSDDT